MSEIKCGTYAGYQRHTRRKEPACDPCKAASAEHSREFRARNDSWRITGHARTKALTRLARKYRADFLEFYADELGKEREAS